MKITKVIFVIIFILANSIAARQQTTTWQLAELEDDNRDEPPLPFNISWQMSPPLRNGTDFKATTEWGYFQTYYLDRNYIFLSVNPILYGGVMLQTYNDMKNDSLVALEDQATWTCTVTIDTPVVAYLLWDHRTLPYVPYWIDDDGWELTSEIQETTDYSMGFFAIFRKYFRANEPIVLHHHLMGSGDAPFAAQSMYIVIFVPLTTENFPSSFRLWQNYPNPFRTTTNLQYSLLDPGYVTIEIYNNQGQLVRKLVNMAQPSGVYVIQWDGRDDNGVSMPSGIYWAKYRAGLREAPKIKIIKLR